MKVRIGGHKGMGSTDIPPAPSMPGNAAKPAENTLPSFREAFARGADFVELDAVPDAGGVMRVIHSDNLAWHVFGPSPYNSVGETNSADLDAVQTGANQKGHIPTLSETLDAIRLTDAFNRASFTVNIEIKNNNERQKGVFKPGPDSYYDLLAETVGRNGFPLDKIVFSSFAARDLVEMKKRLPDAKLGFLFFDPVAGDGYGDEDDIYPGEGVDNACYLKFTPENIDRVYGLVKFDYVHPQIDSLTPATLEKVREYGLGVNAWIWNETPGSNTKPITDALELASGYLPELSLITDDVAAMRALTGSGPALAA
jgi:glycerophosphoryl diester phosphodiesterase